MGTFNRNSHTRTFTENLRKLVRFKLNTLASKETAMLLERRFGKVEDMDEGTLFRVLDLLKLDEPKLLRVLLEEDV